MENEIKKEAQEQSAQQETQKQEVKAPKLDENTKILLEAENIKLKQSLSDLHYANAGFKSEYKEWVQTLLEKEGKHLYDENIKDTLNDKKFNIFKVAKSDTASAHVSQQSEVKTNDANAKQKPLTEAELENIKIYIPGVEKE